MNYYEYMMSQCGVKADLVLYSILINIAAETKNVEKAIGYLSEMEINNVIPNDVTYTTILKACSKRRDKKEVIFEIYEKMKLQGHVPDLVVYNILFSSLSKEKDVERMNDTLKEMRFKNIKPNEHTFVIYFNTYASLQRKRRFHENEKNINICLSLFGQLLENNIVVNTFILNSLFKLYTRFVFFFLLF
jgi:pentatricopeptide repeat protein